MSPDPKFVKWINPDIPKGQQRDIAVMVGEGGGVFAMDRNDGKFLWATPFPYDTPNFLIKNIDVKTGKTEINWDLVFKDKGEKNHTHLLLQHQKLLAHGVQPEDQLFVCSL